MADRDESESGRGDPAPPGVGHEVRAARKALGLSTRELAARIGTSQPFVSNIENARIFPSLRTLGLLADALELPVNRLLRGSERTERVGAAVGMRGRRTTEPPGRRVLGATDSLLQVWRIELRPGEAEPRPFTHPGEDFIIVTAGELLLLREGMAPVRLAAGDSVAVDGVLPHRLAVAEGAPSAGIALVVQAPSPSAGSGGVESDPDQDLEDSVGNAVRSVRQRRTLSTRALARLAGISQPLLSKIETGKALPSVPSLYAIAEALGVGPAEFLPRGQNDQTPSTHGVPLPPSQDDEASPVSTRLLHAAPGHGIEAYLVDHAAGHRDAAAFYHSGEDVIHVLAGQVTLHCGGTRLRLAVGDTAWIDGTTPHSFETPRESGVTAVIVTVR